MEKQEIDRLIDQYVLGQISPENNKRLQLELEKSPILKKDLKLRTDLVKSMEYIEESELRKTLNTINEEEIVKPRLVKKKRKIIYSIVGLLILLGALYFINTMTKPPNDISGPIYFAENYTKYQSSSGNRGEEKHNGKVSILELYSTRKYDAIIDQSRETVNKLSGEELLIAGNAAIEIKEWNLAISLFDEILNSKNYFFADHAAWYKALCQLQVNDIKAAKESLRILALKANSDHHQEAKDLLAKIDQ